MNVIPIISCGDREPHERHLVTTGFGQSMCPGVARPDQTSIDFARWAARQGARVTCVRVTPTGETSDRCDLCDAWSTHDVEVNGAVHKSCDEHIGPLITT